MFSASKLTILLALVVGFTGNADAFGRRLRCQSVSYTPVCYTYCWNYPCDPCWCSYPNFGSVTLKAGFLPDPYVKDLIAGGGYQTTRGGVRAWVRCAPDFQVNYTAGSYPLTFYVESKGDTTLLIQLPDGRFFADDDSGSGLNPWLRVRNPQSGCYRIWVGTFNQGQFPAAKLNVSERVSP